MMKLFLYLIFIPVLNFIPNNENLNNCKGINNLVFGSQKESYKNLSLEYEEGNSQLYNLNNNDLQIEGVLFEFIRLTFIKNKLTSISLSTKNGTRSAFFKYLKDKYGAPTKIKNRFEWVGIHTKIVFEFYDNNKDAAVDFYKK